MRIESEKKGSVRSKRRLASILAGAVLVSSLLIGKEAKADDPPMNANSFIVGGRLSQSRDVSLNIPNLTLNFSGFNYKLGDEDITMNVDGKDMKVFDTINGFGKLSLDDLGTLLKFWNQLRDNLGIDHPGSYGKSISGSFVGYSELYHRGKPYEADINPVELGASGDIFARGSAYLNLKLDYDNAELPSYLKSSFNAGYEATLRASIALGMEAGLDKDIGLGVAARKFFFFDGSGYASGNFDASFQNGITGNANVSIQKSQDGGYGYMPYLTLSHTDSGMRIYSNVGLEYRHEDISTSNKQQNAQIVNGSSQSTNVNSSPETTRDSLVPQFSFILAPEKMETIYPILSVSYRDNPLVRGGLGVKSGRILFDGSLSSGLDAHSEMMVLIRGSVSDSEFSSYLFENEKAMSGFFPAWRSRMMFNRQSLMASGSKLLFRSTMDYDHLLSELSAEDGLVYSKPGFFIDSGIRLFSAETFGGGLYNTIGTSRFFTTQSYSTGFKSDSPIVHNFLFTIGGYLP